MDRSPANYSGAAGEPAMVMHGNGGDAYAALAARVAELEAAHALLVRRWDAELVPRLVDIDADLDHLARAIVRLLDARRADEPARHDGAPPTGAPSSPPTDERPATTGQRE